MKKSLILLLAFGTTLLLHAQSVPRVEVTRLWTTGQSLTVTLENEGFEAGLGDFVNTGGINWTTTSSEAQEGTKSATSNTVFGGQNAIFGLSVVVPTGYTATLQYYILADTVQGPDMTDDIRIGFEIDGTAQSNTIITNAWSQKTYFIAEGNHNLTWKVFHNAPGSDDEVQAYLDNVVINYNRRPAFRMADGSQGFGKILTSDVHGNASWKTLSEISTYDNAGGSSLLPLILDGRHQIQNPLKVIDGNGSGIQSNSNTLHGYNALSNSVNGYRASNNGSNGFEGLSNGANGFKATSNDSYGFLASSNNVDGFHAADNAGHGYSSLSNMDDGFHADSNGGNGFYASYNFRGFYAVFNTHDGFYSINNTRGFNATNNDSDGFYATNNLSGFEANSNTNEGFHAKTNAGYGFYAEANEDDGFFSEANTGNGYSALGNTGNGYSAVDNITNGYYALSNDSDGFEAKNNVGHGVYVWQNTGDGVNAFDNTGNGYTANANDDNGFHANNNGGDGFYAASNSGDGVNAYQNTGDGIVADGNGDDGFYAVNNTGEGLYATGNNTGVYAYFNDTYGIRAHANTLDGIYSHTNTGDEGYFSGTVTVTGNLSKGGGSFKIDHPLDPENKFLYHSFVESPDMMNVYNGNVLLDANGKATVQMEAWFGPLNRDFRYQLTAIGAPGPNLHIAQEINNNQFRIAGGTPGMKVSWQVTGIRQDPYANQNRIHVEVEKPAEFKGYYIHPEAYDRGFEQGFDFVKLGHKTLEELDAEAVAGKQVRR